MQMHSFNLHLSCSCHKKVFSPVFVDWYPTYNMLYCLPVYICITSNHLCAIINIFKKHIAGKNTSTIIYYFVREGNIVLATRESTCPTVATLLATIPSTISIIFLCRQNYPLPILHLVL